LKKIDMADEEYPVKGRDILITAGEPAGIGTEIILKAWARLRRARRSIPFVAIGSVAVFERYREILPFPTASVQPVDRNAFEAGRIEWDRISTEKISVIDIGLSVDMAKLNVGADSIEGGKCAADTLRCAFRIVKANPARLLVTTPVSKKSLQMADFPYQGHTDFLADQCAVKECGMMFVCDEIKMMLYTAHVSLAEALASLDREGIYRKILFFRDVLVSDFGIDDPAIAVMGVNPHCGETPDLGTQEHEVILPAIVRASEEDVKVSGPWTFERLFAGGMYREYDGILAMYHDQGIMPLKLLFPGKTVNYTAGLSFVRTSVDHGTAYDIAGRGIADPLPLMEAIRWARVIGERRDGSGRPRS
jgi:4-hydroxythreonine-4-phosphate dehydrogenase